ncbi:Phosphoglycerate mutase [Apiotrichum porosum]|uniref:Phosphoglycerate mutase n=1 Tax=Apiotrichum porosum TaxID=105984 RepID=A0A427XLB9_9TREE|nr:Phosphoglycerate mutase [Apiotrichum porosum]RSH79691.1 Phosphoglycerate mutase [Apiotrichum porosum]
MLKATHHLSVAQSSRKMPYTLVLLRHGQSEWNAKDQFTGWVDAPLSELGRAEALRGGELLKERNILPDVVHTSVLRRAIETANISLDKADRNWIPVHRSWRLNERHYGALQGKNKAQTRDAYGDEQFMLWRRSYDTPPPPIEVNSKYSQDKDPRYTVLAGDIPRTECLKDVVQRMLPYFHDAIVPDLQANKVVLVAAHGNSLRALVKHLDEISDTDIAALNIPTGIPLVYELDEKMKPLKRGGEYLDPEEAAKSAAAVANQGKK